MLQRNPDRRSDLRSVAIFLIPFSLAFLIPGLWLLHSVGNTRQNWVDVDAQGNGGTIVSYTRKGRRGYRTWVEVSYRVNGTGYVTPVSPAFSSSNRGTAEETVARYAPGTRHRIRCNLANPHDIRLDVSGRSEWLLPGVFSGVGAALLAIGLWAFRRSREPHRGLSCPSCRTPLLERYTYCPSCRTRVTPRDQKPSNGYEEEAELANAIKSNKGERIGGAVMLALGLAMLGGAAMAALKPYRALQWPRSQARILRSDLIREQGARARAFYRLRVEVEFQVDGGRYTAASETPSIGNYAWLRQTADTLAAGSTIALRYNPAELSDVFLEQNWRVEMLILPIALGLLGLFFGPIGGCVVWRAQRFRQIRCPACRLPAAANHRWCARCASPISSG